MRKILVLHIFLIISWQAYCQSGSTTLEMNESDLPRLVFANANGTIVTEKDLLIELKPCDFEAWNWDDTYEENNTFDNTNIKFGEDGDHHYLMVDVDFPLLCNLEGFKYFGYDNSDKSSFRIAMYKQSNLGGPDELIFDHRTTGQDDSFKELADVTIPSELVYSKFFRYYLKITPYNDIDYYVPGDVYSEWEGYSRLRAGTIFLRIKYH